MRFVTPRTVEQQDIQMLHRIRERLVKSRTALINESRGLLGEYGVIVPQGRKKFAKHFLEIINNSESKLNGFARECLYDLYQEYLEIEKRISHQEDKLRRISKSHPECERLEQIPGVGYFTSTAILGMVANIGDFKNSREFSAYLGLVPRQHSTGGKEKLMGISKRGNAYLRKLLIHGARASLRWVDKQSFRRGIWLKQLKERRGHNVTTVALANKNARVIWAMLTRGEDYKQFEVLKELGPIAGEH